MPTSPSLTRGISLQIGAFASHAGLEEHLESAQTGTSLSDSESREQIWLWESRGRSSCFSCCCHTPFLPTTLAISPSSPWMGAWRPCFPPMSAQQLSCGTRLEARAGLEDRQYVLLSLFCSILGSDPPYQPWLFPQAWKWLHKLSQKPRAQGSHDQWTRPSCSSMRTRGLCLFC